MNVEVQPYFTESERYPALIGVRAEGDEYETAYVSKSELVDALAENDKLQDEIKRLHANQAHWELGNCPGCPNVADLQEALDANAKLRKLVQYILDECYGDDWFGEKAEELGFKANY